MIAVRTESYVPWLLATGALVLVLAIVLGLL